jgi:hypothetical protein
MSIWPTKRAPGSRTRSFCTCQGLRPRRGDRALAISRPFVLPSAQLTASALGKTFFRGSMAGLCAPLPTLRRHPRGRLRTARGRCGSLLLHRSGLPPLTPCRSPGAPTVMLVLLRLKTARRGGLTAATRNVVSRATDFDSARPLRPKNFCSMLIAGGVPLDIRRRHGT